MIHTNETHPEDNLDEVALGIFQDALSPVWLLRVIKITGLAIFILIGLAYAF